MDKYTLIATCAFLAVVILWIKNKLHSISSTALDKAVQQQKEISNEAVNDAISAADNFESRLQQYRDQKRSSDSGENGT